MTWICPDCTTDLSSTAKHSDAWRFCPFTGRPQGVLHVTPQEMQYRWNATMESLRRLGPKAEFLAMGLLHEWAAEIDHESYLGKGTGTSVIPDFPDEGTKEAWDAGRRDLVDLLKHTVEWRHHLVDLMTGERGLKSFDGKDIDPGMAEAADNARGFGKTLLALLKGSE